MALLKCKRRNCSFYFQNDDRNDSVNDCKSNENHSDIYLEFVQVPSGLRVY